MIPIRLEISTARIRSAENWLNGGRSDRFHRAGDVSGNGQVILRGEFAIRAKSAAQKKPAIAAVWARESRQMVLIEIVGEDTEVGVLARGSSVLQGAKTLVEVPGSGHHHSAASFGSVFRDDVDDSIDRIGAPGRASGAAYNFNSLDVFQRHVLHIPDR